MKTKYFVTLFTLISIIHDCYSQNWNFRELNDSIGSYLRPFVESKLFMGSILIAKGDSIIFLDNYGYSNLEHLVPNSSNTVYRIGSIIKYHLRLDYQNLFLIIRMETELQFINY